MYVPAQYVERYDLLLGGTAVLQVVHEYNCYHLILAVSFIHPHLYLDGMTIIMHQYRYTRLCTCTIRRASYFIIGGTAAFRAVHVNNCTRLIAATFFYPAIAPKFDWHVQTTMSNNKMHAHYAQII